LEDYLQLFQLQGRGDAEHAAVTIKTAVSHQDVAVRIVGTDFKSVPIAEGLDSDDGAGDGIVFGNRILKKYLQRVPGAAAQACPREGSDRQEASDSPIRSRTGSEKVTAKERSSKPKLFCFNYVC
jgi:hypothetical protein